MIKTARFDNKVLVVLALLVASSDPVQQEVLIQLIINLLDATGGQGKRERCFVGALCKKYILPLEKS